ncbi:MAG: pyruvate dehydrogenase (acetyl-transferring) E1 component subunit alpha [Deltaproteobacteria bacterium]|nr:pyruvate dehydrogenase (acetyl-transferring) E1 component subunit alpha [Deltaproteobacteria bacterium]MCL4873142.1 pyruvate dehydrogenase (acetyl-transferring) E1 component subunit alpha [bacterium]
MPTKTVSSSETKNIQIINEKGEADGTLVSRFTEDDFRRFFETIILARTFNHRALSLQREGRLGTYASIWGQEASQIGTALAFGEEDWLFPSFRESGVYIARGYPIWMLYRYWAGDERGMQAPPGFNLFPMSVPVGTQVPHATGAAWAMKLKGHRNAAAVYFGDGGSSKGDFHEGLNFAGVFKVPAIFICQNNQWAISVPRSRQTAAKTIAERAFGYGFEGVQVDGNDITAVYKVTKDAIEKARAGGGPTLIECFTYRLDDHTTADDSSRYRSDDEVEYWKEREPLKRLRTYMEGKGWWTKEYEDDLTKKAEERIDSEIRKAEAFEAPDPADIIKYTYGSLTPRQARELKELKWRG